jgi:hypothetical protein
MMSLSTQKAKVLQEINLIPEDRLSDIYNVLHYFRLGLEASRENPKSVMRFAGCWQDMPDQVFAAFTQEIQNRRQQAFSRRRGNAASPD